jgi:hypothetical protein
VSSIQRQGFSREQVVQNKNAEVPGVWSNSETPELLDGAYHARKLRCLSKNILLDDASEDVRTKCSPINEKNRFSTTFKPASVKNVLNGHQAPNVLMKKNGKGWQIF